MLGLSSRHDRPSPNAALPGRCATSTTTGRCSTPNSDRSVNKTVRQTIYMEPINRSFRPGFWRLVIPFMIISMLLMFLSALINTGFEGEYPWVSDMVGLTFATYIVAAPMLFVALLVSRMRLRSDGTTLSALLFIGGFTVFRRSVSGESWHAVATPGRDSIDGESIGSYRVEVANRDGERTPVLGPFICWLYRVECL